MSIPFLHSGFKKSSERMVIEQVERRGMKKKLLSFGVNFLDRAMRGIQPGEMVLVAGGSGGGKTQLLSNIAQANVRLGKQMHVFALEAEPHEIERRIKYNLYAKLFFSDQFRPRLSSPFNYTDWLLGEFDKDLSHYDSQVANEYERFENLHTFYKDSTFGIKELLENIYAVADETDGIIVDHVHYFDFDDDNENRALKQLAKTVRDVCQVIGKPIILAAHLRKKDRRTAELCPGLEELHGSSDLTKIATKVITIARGEVIEPGLFETYFRIPKNRYDGSVTSYIAKTSYSIYEGQYRNDFQLGFLTNHGQSFEPLMEKDEPHWLRSGT